MKAGRGDDVEERSGCLQRVCRCQAPRPRTILLRARSNLVLSSGRLTSWSTGKSSGSWFKACRMALVTRLRRGVEPRTPRSQSKKVVTRGGTVLVAKRGPLCPRARRAASSAAYMARSRISLSRARAYQQIAASNMCRPKCVGRRSRPLPRHVGSAQRLPCGTRRWRLLFRGSAEEARGTPLARVADSGVES